MSFRLLLCLAVFLFISTQALPADQIEMRNGDHFTGKVLSMTADTVTFQSEMLGKINVPRKNVASLILEPTAPAVRPGTNLIQTPTSMVKTPPSAAPMPSLANTNTDLAAALRNLGSNTNFIQQVRAQMIHGDNPEAVQKYDETVNGLLSGNLNLDDIRRQAQATADQLREMKVELGPQADPTFDSYLQILDKFLSETAQSPPATPATSATPKTSP